jgi:hypothetical protein
MTTIPMGSMATTTESAARAPETTASPPTGVVEGLEGDCSDCAVAISRAGSASEACQFFYRCEGCEAVLKPQPGDCCVFCSYADTPCPPKVAV